MLFTWSIRCGEEHDAESDLRAVEIGGGGGHRWWGRLRRGEEQREGPGGDRPPGDFPGDGRPPRFRGPDGGGEPALRGALAKRREKREGGLRAGLRVLPTPQGAPEAAGGVPLRGGAADARDRAVH